MTFLMKSPFCGVHSKLWSKKCTYPEGEAAHTDAGLAVGGEAVPSRTPAAVGTQLVNAGACAAAVVHRTLVHVCRESPMPRGVSLVLLNKRTLRVPYSLLFYSNGEPSWRE